MDPQKQAGWFARIREAHQTETAEDYVELIADLVLHQKEARLIDIAERMGVANPTASKIINRLREEGYVESAPYKGLALTAKGEELAAYCKARHDIVLRYLLKIGVPRDIAELDAEGIEHHISPETLAIMKGIADQ